MKNKIIITESQYKRLMRSINEQYMNGRDKPDNWDYRLKVGKKNAPDWLTSIIGNDQDGFTITFPPSTDVATLREFVTPEEEAKYNSDRTAQNRPDKSEVGQLVDRVANRIGGSAKKDFKVKMRYDNPLYRAAIIKMYVAAKDSGVKSVSITLESTKTTVPDKEPTTIPGTVEKGVFKFPVNPNLESKKYFVNNDWRLDTEFTDEFKTVTIKEIKDKIASVKNGKGVLNGISISTSCSTLPNGKSIDGKVYTFAELSKLRNKSAKDFILKELASIGVTISPNLDYQSDWQGNLKGEYLGASSAKGDIWGKPGASKNREDYEQDKYLRIKLDLSISGDDVIKTDPKKLPGTTKTQIDYTAVMVVPSIPYKIPNIKFVAYWNPKLKQKCTVKSTGESVCENPFHEKEPLFSKPDWSRDKNDPAYKGPGK